jgi:uracil permease
MSTDDHATKESSPRAVPSSETGTGRTFVYGVDDRPPWLRVCLYGLQWLVIFIPTLTILSSISSEYLGLHGPARLLFFQKILIMTGMIMIVQTMTGHQYPLLDGPATALLLSFVILAPHGLPAIQGGMIVGGMALLAISACGYLRHLATLFTDNVIGVILILIAVTLLPYLVPLVMGGGPSHADGDPVVFSVAILVMVLIALCSHWLHGVLKTISFFLGVLLGTLLMGALGRFDATSMYHATWVSIPHPLVSSMPRISLPAILTFLVAYLAVIINAVGSIHGIAAVVGAQGIGERIRRGIAVTGVGGIVGGIFGVFGTVSYAFSPGVVVVTRVASRFAVTVCGICLCALAFSEKIMAILTIIPPSVVGGAMIAALAAQIGAGISALTRSGRELVNRDYMVVGLPIMTGAVVSILPREFFDAFPPATEALIQNGLIIGIVLVLLLEHVLLPRKS